MQTFTELSSEPEELCVLHQGAPFFFFFLLEETRKCIPFATGHAVMTDN